MGVSMSKSDNSCSEDSGVVYIKDTPPSKRRQSYRRKSYQTEQLRSRTPTPTAHEEESDIVQTLCPADDDEIEDTGWKDIYQRLKSNKNFDLHATTSRFHSSESEDRNTINGPVFTSSLNERSTRVNSANFNPHAVVYHRDDIGARSQISVLNEGLTDGDENYNADINVDIKQETSSLVLSFREAVTKGSALQTDESENSIADDVSYIITDNRNDKLNAEKFAESKEIPPISPLENICIVSETGGDLNSRMFNVLNDSSYVSLNIEGPTENDETELKDGNYVCINDNLLSRSSKLSGFLTPQQYCGASNYGDDENSDPFEGLGFPRERAASFGSASIVSVKDFQDELYNEYFYEVRRCIRNYGYFEKFPSPSLLRYAQRTFRQLNLPTPVDDDGRILPHPPKETRDDVFGKHNFGDVDQRVIFAPDNLSEGRLADIATYLCSGLEDEVQKVRAVYTWLTFRQMSQEKTKKTKSRESWCKMFRKLCRFARLETRLVHGIIRNRSYIPGEDLEKHRGSWVSVLVNNSWWVLDPIADSSCDNDRIHNDMTKRFTQSHCGNGFDLGAGHQESPLECDGFFQDPEEFIFSHFPDTEYWQLLARPVTKNEFTDMAVLGDGFFKLHMSLLSQNKSIVVVETESVSIQLGFPGSANRQFMCDLFYCNDTSLESETVICEGKKVALRQFVFLETIMEKSRVNINVRFPHIGSYILCIYGNGGTVSESSYICSYRLVYSNAKCSSPLPVINRQEWGPGLDALRMGLTPISHKSGEIVMDKKVIQVAFQDARRLQFKFDLRQDGKIVDREDIKFSFLRNEGEDIVFVLDMEPSVIGIFTLNLYARAKSSRSFYNICTYLVRKVEFKDLPECGKPSEKKVTAQLYTYRHVEDQSKMEIIEAPDDGSLQLTVDTSEVSKLLVELKLQAKQELNFSEHARHWIENDKGFVELNFPREGRYKLRIMGRCRLTNHFKTLHEKNISVNIPSEKWSPFPKALEEWNSYYKIEEPVRQHLEEKTNIRFRIVINGAHDVALLAANGWYHMEQEGSFWTGIVKTGPKSTRSRLLARFELGSEKFSELLMFKVISSEDLDLLNERQEIIRNGAIEKRKVCIQ